MLALDSPRGAALADVWPPGLPEALCAEVAADIGTHGYAYLGGTAERGPLAFSSSSAIVVWEDGLVIRYHPSAVGVESFRWARELVAPRHSTLPVREERSADGASDAETSGGDEAAADPPADESSSRTRTPAPEPRPVPPIHVRVDRATAKRIKTLAQRAAVERAQPRPNVARAPVVTERPAPPTTRAQPARTRQAAPSHPRTTHTRRHVAVPPASQWLRLVTTAAGPVQPGVCETVLDPVGYVRLLDGTGLVVAAKRGAALAIGDHVGVVLPTEPDELASVVDSPTRTTT